MAVNKSIIKSYSWSDVLRGSEVWIKSNDVRYQTLRVDLIDKIFPVLREEDKTLLLDGLIKIINLIHLKFNFEKNNEKPDNLLWDQLVQNNLLDLHAILGIMLPYIKDNETNDNKHKLKSLSELYIKKNDDGAYIYTNTQYNRCIRKYNNGHIDIEFRPYKKEYFYQHLELLLMSIETVSNKLYVNWVDILPVTMNEFINTKLYSDTVAKITRTDKSDKYIELINNYIDPNPGISYQDFFNVLSNHLYHEIKNYKWLIYDIIISGTTISYITYLENKIDLNDLWNELLWSQLSINSRDKFTYQWNNFMSSLDTNDNIILSKFYFFFGKYHVNARELINRQELILTRDPTDEDDDEENSRVTPETTRNAVRGLSKVPVEEIYLFFNNQLSAFKKSWFYYASKIKKMKYLDKQILGDTKIEIFVTPKNVYNYCKSLTHYSALDINNKNKYYEIPNHWNSLKPELIEMVLVRILDIKIPDILPSDYRFNDWTDPNWFNINKYLRRLYPAINESDLPKANYLIHSIIKTHLVEIVFESLIYHGLLSDFRPEKNITNNSIVESLANSTDDIKKKQIRHQQMRKMYFTGNNRKKYEDQAYYFITGSTYGQLTPLKTKRYPPPSHEKKYFDFLTSDQNWTFTYAMNWISQINFYHHYSNNRIMYITGATGVGKSTQVPPLLMYSQKMLDYNTNGKIICTQPRVKPTVDNAENISTNLGVPIVGYNKTYDKNTFTSNFYVQYKHQKEQHTKNSNSYLRIVTDGTLYEEIKSSPFLTKSAIDTTAVDSNGDPVEWVKNFSSTNKYDIVIVDEAHEHNTNMDMILTLVRDSVYVNNSTKLVIISATMEDDEPIYRRYYRRINDNRTYPLSAFIENRNVDRANMDRRIHISPPGKTTQYEVKDFFASKAESDLLNEDTYVNMGIEKTIKIANSTTDKDILLFMAGQDDIKKSVKRINESTASNIIALGFYSELDEDTKIAIGKIHETLQYYTRYKEDVFLDEFSVTRRVPEGTYTRAIIVATNVAEASITLQNLKYVIDTGYAKTVIFDPLEGISKTLTLPISWSSSVQRRGRVGRVASGEVYYLYAKEKIVNNKTAYKIADSNVKDHIVSLLKMDPRDHMIISKENDINFINNLLKIRQLLESDIGYYSENLVWEFFGNPRTYLDIIKKQYLYVDDLTDVRQYYTYYGRNDMDDYDYQTEIYEFNSRSFTGYDSFILEDNNLTFYIIHPDENVIKRDLYTGKMINIKCSTSVTDSYYYYLLKNNNVPFNDKDIDTCNFKITNFNNFFLLKYQLAIDDAKSQLLVTEIPEHGFSHSINYINITDLQVREYISSYNNLINYFYQEETTMTIRSTFLSNLSEIQRITSLPILNDINNMLWYSYSLPWNLEDDVLAIILFISIVTDVSQLMLHSKSAADIKKFFVMHSNNNGDIYFVWKLWGSIKDILIKYRLFDITKINANTESLFKSYKEKYLKNIKIPFNEFLIFDQMYKSGQLNVRDEFYYYVSKIPFRVSDFNELDDFDKHLKIIANNNEINDEILFTFVLEYLENLFTQNKKIWLYQYEINNYLLELPGENIIDITRRKLLLPGIINNPHYVPNEWDRIFEAYIRSFSMNLIKNEGHNYLNLSRGIYIDPLYWSKKLRTEKTFLKNKTEYIIYHNTQAIKDSISLTYLSPVKIEWVIQLNPMYYYYLFFGSNNPLYKMKEYEGTLEAIKIIEKNEHLFDYNALISYLDRIDNPIISRIIRNGIYKQKQKN
jgi:hypothetical protein